MAPHLVDDERRRVLRLLQRHGYNTTSFQVLEAGFRYWFSPDGEGAVAYVDTGRAWVAAGAPIAPEAGLASLCEGFARSARQAGRRACFFATEARLGALGWLESAPIGLQPSWSPPHWEQTLRSTRSLREQLRRARAKGVQVRQVEPAELTSPDLPLRRELERFIGAWLQTRKMAPMGFLVAVEPFHFPEERRYFIAEHQGRLVALLVAVPIYARQGWLFEDLLRQREAPNGTSELLIDTAMRQVAAEGSQVVTLGLAPLAGEVSPALRLARRTTRLLYDFEGLRRFKARLRPDHWERIDLAWPKGSSGTVALLDALAAFTLTGAHRRASFLRFGLRTLLGVPALGALGARGLALLLLALALWLLLSPPGGWLAPWLRLGLPGGLGALGVLLLALARPGAARAAAALPRVSSR